jgi:hypothetical protein
MTKKDPKNNVNEKGIQGEMDEVLSKGKKLNKRSE